MYGMANWGEFLNWIVFNISIDSPSITQVGSSNSSAVRFLEAHAWLHIDYQRHFDITHHMIQQNAHLIVER